MPINYKGTSVERRDPEMSINWSPLLREEAYMPINYKGSCKRRRVDLRTHERGLYAYKLQGNLFL
jgi:hypothetical protein